MRRCWRDGVLRLLAAGLLAACTAATAQPKVDLETRQGEGHVLLKVVSARPVSGLNPKWKTLVLESKARGWRVELNDLSDPASSGSLFFGRIDEGDYEIVELQSLGPSGSGLLLAILFADAQDMRSRIGTVAVRSGALTNLGTLVVAPSAEKDQAPGIEYLDGPAGHKSAVDDFERRTGRRLDLPAQRPERSAEAEREILVRARALIALISWGDDAQGSGLLGGAALGQVAARVAGGRWQLETLDSLDDVKYARRLADGTLIAGFTQGRYAVRRPGKSWTYINLPEADAVVAHIDTTPDGGALFVASSASKTTVLHRASLDQPEAEARPLLTLDFPYYLRGNTVLSLEDSLMLVENHPGFSRVADVTIIDKQSLQVRGAKVDFWIRSWQRVPSGEIVISRQNGMSYYTSVTSDRGATWLHGEAAGPTLAHFVDRQQGYGLNISPGAFTVTVQLMKTLDGGKTWAETGVPMTRKAGGRIVYAGADGEVIVTSGFEMYSTLDDGKNWARVVLRGPE